MKNFLKKTGYFFSILGILALAFSTLAFKTSESTAYAQAGKVSGWLWSDNIGWVSMACENTPGGCDNFPYGVTQQADGTWTGYAWADTIGWMRFDAGCPVKTPLDECGAKIVGTELRGWARFCSGGLDGPCSDRSRPDWDGWVSLSSYNEASPVVIYGPTSSGGNMSGYAWGSIIVGWLSFADVSAPPPPPPLVPYVDLAPNPTSVSSGGSSLLTVNAFNFVGSVSCSIAGIGSVTMTNSTGTTWTGSIPSGPLTVTTTFTALCTGPSGTDDGTATVTVGGSGSEICGNGIDDDGDGAIDEGCGGGGEICGNGIDDDGDGAIDEGCPGGGPTECSDGKDNDLDGLIDHSSVTPSGATPDPGCSSPLDRSELNRKPIFIEF